MERKLKNLFSRRSHSRQRNNLHDSPRVPVNQTPQTPQTHGIPPPPSTRATDGMYHATDPVPAPHVSPGPEARPVAQTEFHSYARSNSVSSPKRNSNRSSVSGTAVTASDRRRASRPTVVIGESMNQAVPEDNIADNYTAYLPALTQTPQYMTLGGDTRLMHNASERRHGEDIADRNIKAASSLRSTSRRDSYARYEESDRNSGRFSSLHFDQHSINSWTGSLDSSFRAAVQPVKTPRSEASMQWRRRRSGVKSDGGDVNDNAPRASDYGPRNTVNIKKHDQPDTATTLNMDGAHDDYLEGGAVQPISTDIHDNLHPDTNKLIDLSHTVDIDKTTTWAPAVTHETVKPTSHEIITEEIHRTIHNHSVYHYIQLVSSLEILPTRHFVLSPTNPSTLIEIPESQVPPSSTPKTQRWFIGTRPASPDAQTNRFFAEERRTEPVIVSDKRYMTAEGFERRETTILYPPTLEDMSGYEGLVLPIHFDGEGGAKEERMCQFGKLGRENGGVVQRGEDGERGSMDGKEKRMSMSHVIHRKPVLQSIPRDGSVDTDGGKRNNKDVPPIDTVRMVERDEGSGAREGHSSSSSAPQRWPSTSSSLSIATRMRNRGYSAKRWVDLGPSTHARFEKVAS